MSRHALLFDGRMVADLPTRATQPTASHRANVPRLHIPTEFMLQCGELRRLDRAYGTDPDSPLHHDNRECPVHGRANR